MTFNAIWLKWEGTKQWFNKSKHLMKKTLINVKLKVSVRQCSAELGRVFWTHIQMPTACELCRKIFSNNGYIRHI